MRYAALAMFVMACGGEGSTTRYFRVLGPAAATKPDSCYQAPTLPAAMTADEMAAQSFCGVGKKSTSSGTTTTIEAAVAWTMVDVGGGNLFLVMQSGTTSLGYPGKLDGTTYKFNQTTTNFVRQCPGTGVGVVECNGVCVNRQSDPANCGSCGFTCGSGQVCRFGVCQAMCDPPIMQTCNGVLVNTNTDDMNCGICARACTAPQVCSRGICVDACSAGCDKYNASACGMARQFQKKLDSEIDFEVQKGSLTGTLAETTSYDCTPPGCSTDFAMRCPSCATSVNLVGNEDYNVTEFQQR